MHEFLADNPAFYRLVPRSERPKGKLIRTRILDEDLDADWIGAAAIHCKRRGLTLSGLTSMVSRNLPGQDVRWIDVRDVILGRPEPRWRSHARGLFPAVDAILHAFSTIRPVAGSRVS